MFRIYGFDSINNRKVLYVAEAIGTKYEFIPLDPFQGEHKKEDHLKRNPFGKTPALEHAGKTLFESSTICRYMAKISQSDLYPTDIFKGSVVDQWLDFAATQMGWWFGTLLFERHDKEKYFGMGEADPQVVDQALGILNQQLPVLDQCLKKNKYIAGNEITIADYCIYAYLETTEKSNFSLKKFSGLDNYYNQLQELEPIKAVQNKLKNFPL